MVLMNLYTPCTDATRIIGRRAECARELTVPHDEAREKLLMRTVAGSLRRRRDGGLALCAVLIVVACQSSPDAVPRPQLAPTATWEPTPAAPREVTADDLIRQAAVQLAAVRSARFDMVDEDETGAEFFGTTVRSMEAEVQSPDSVRLLLSVVAPALGFVKIEIIAAGKEAFMKFSEDAPWAPLPLDQMPFDFADVGPTLSDALHRMTNATIAGQEDVDGVSTVRIDGMIASDNLTDLITSADTGHPIILSLWLDESDRTLRRMRILGRLYDDDAAETSRVLNFTMDAVVDIRIPDVTNGQ